jgi:glycosyltransferase involved in cell wall biosynthesis
MISQPRTSIIMATFNRSNVLKYSIGSVLNQSDDDWELLVVGDGCTDDSEKVVATFNDPRIRWIGLPSNSGHQSTPNNTGLREAKGTYIAYLGHDDVWLPHHLSCCGQALEGGSDLVFGATLQVMKDHRRNYIGPPEYFPGSWIPPSSVVHRSSLVDKCGDWRYYKELSSIMPDAELWQRFHDSGAKFSRVPRLTVVKIPASDREGVYTKRCDHEQSFWFKRIQMESDFEPAQLIACCFNGQRLDSAACGDTRYRRILKFTTFEFFRRITKMRRKKGGYHISHIRKFKGANFEETG